MNVTVAATQMSCSWDVEENLENAERLIRDAAEAGAQIVLPQEMFATHFFAFSDWKPEHFRYAETIDGPIVNRLARLAAELEVVIPVNFFERANNAYFNTVAVIDADGAVLGVYRKTHIPAGPPGCFEKIYTSPGDTGFKVWQTKFCTIGSGICWDQWFPESARIMCLLGADVLFYPTGIGSECHDHWSTVIRGHAGANLVPVVIANRVGTETGELGQTTFWGQSFICGPTGETLAEADDHSDTFICCTFDVDQIRQVRANWGVFRDRRPDAYGPLLTMDGVTPAL